MVVQTRVSRQRATSWLWRLRVVGGRGQGHGCLCDADSVSCEVRMDRDCGTVESDWRRNVEECELSERPGRTRDDAGGGEQRVIAASRTGCSSNRQGCESLPKVGRTTRLGISGVVLRILECV